MNKLETVNLISNIYFSGFGITLNFTLKLPIRHHIRNVFYRSNSFRFNTPNSDIYTSFFPVTNNYDFMYKNVLQS